MRRVHNRADFSTVAVTLVADDQRRPPARRTTTALDPGDAARDALRVLEVAAGVVLIAWPSLGPARAPRRAGRRGARWTARRRRERALDAV